MLNRIKLFLAAPVFEDEEKTRLARLLDTILKALFVVVVVLTLAVGAISTSPDRPYRPLVSAATIAVVLGLFILMRLGRVRLASVLLPSALLVTITVAISTLGGIRSAATGGYLVVIVIAGLLLGGRGAIVFSLLSALAAWAVVYAETRRLIIPVPASTGFSTWIVEAGIFGIIAVLLSLATRSIREGLENARRLRAVEEERARELDALLAAERKRAQQLKLLTRVAHQLVGYADPQALMGEAVRRLHEDFGFEHIALLLLDGGELVSRAQHGAFAHLLPEHLRVPLGRGIVGWVAQTGMTYLANDVSTDGRFHPIPGANTASELAAPLRLGPRVIGVLDVESEQAGAFDAADVSTLESLADLLAAGLQASRLFETERRRAIQLRLLDEVSRQIAGTLDEREIFQRTVDALEYRFGFTEASIMLPVEHDEMELVAHAGADDLPVLIGFRQKTERGVIGHVARTRATYLVHDIRTDPYYSNLAGRAAGSALGVPMLREGQLQGVLYVESSTFHAFSPDDVQTLETLANHVATAMENARLYARARARLREMAALQSGAQAVASSLELSQIFQAVVQLLQDTFSYRYVSIYRLDGEMLRLGAQVGYPTELIYYEIPITAGITGRAVRTRQTQFVKDVSAEPDFLRASDEVHSEICIPLLKGQIVLGILNVECTPGQPLTEADLDLLTVFASQVTVAIENARLFEAERAQRELAEALREVGIALSASLDFETVLDRLLDQIARVVAYDTANIMLVDPASGWTRMARLRGYEQFGPEVVRDTARLSFEVATTENLRRMDESGQPFIIPDTAAFPGWVRVKASAFIRSWAGAPIRARGQTIAFFSLGRQEPNFYRLEDTERLAAFAGQAALALQNAQLFEAERRRADELAVLNAVATAAAEATDVDTLIARVTAVIGRTLYPDTFGVLLLDEAAGVLRPHPSYHGIGEADRHRTARLSEGIAGVVAARGTSWRVSDVTQEPAYLQFNPEMRSEVCVPLKSGDRVLGVVNAESARLAAFSAADEQLLMTVAGQLATAIENVRLFAATAETLVREQRLNEMAHTISSTLDPSVILPNIVRLAVELVGAEAGSMAMVSSDGQMMIYPHLYNLPVELSLEPTPRGQGMAWRIVETGEPVFVTDYASLSNALPHWIRAGVRGIIGVAVVAGEARLGALGLFSLNPVKHFTERDLHLAEAVGRQAGVAIQNARLFEAEQRRAEEQRLLFGAARDFTAGLSEDAVLYAIVRHMVGALKVAFCAVSFWEPAEEVVITLIAYTPASGAMIDRKGRRYALADYPATRRVLESRQPLLIRSDDPTADPSERALLDQFGYGRVLMLPLVVGEQVYGLVELYREPGAAPLSESDIQLAQSLAAQAGVALENARLHTTVTERARELNALLTANAAMLSTLDLDPLLKNILQAALAAIPAAEKGTILLQDPATGHLQIRAVSGYTDARVQNFSFAGNEGYAARSAREQRPLLIPDARADPAIRYDGDIPEVRSILSAVAAPLVLHDQTLGVITLDSARTAAFTEADLRLLVGFANTAAVVIDHARLHAEVRALAVTDGLTGLTNHRAFDQALKAEVIRAGRYGYPLALVFLDLDSFKLYNDTYGHPAGNERLKAIAALLHERVREPDLAARYGGEEFALILPHTAKEGALVLAERIRAAAEAAAPDGRASGTPVSGYTLSLGVAVFPDDALTPDDLLRAADNAGLAAKRAGKNRVVAAPALAHP